jgi:hypothetical protein
MAATGQIQSQIPLAVVNPALRIYEAGLSTCLGRPGLVLGAKGQHRTCPPGTRLPATAHGQIEPSLTPEGMTGTGHVIVQA